MKMIFLTAVLIVTSCMLAMGNKFVAKGESNSPFGDYRIEKLEDHLIFNNKELDKYVITYANTDMKVIIAMDKQKKCKKYYVLSDKCPVQYECNGVYFGIKKMDADLQFKGYQTSLDKLNKMEYYHQKVLASGTTTTVDHLQLIASYYPGFFNAKVS